jgi:undecaprenyl-diphosphatase
VTDLHRHPPITLAHVRARHWWLLPVAGALFAALATGAVVDLLVWDEPVTQWLVRQREPWLDDVFRGVSFLGSTRVVLGLAAVAAALAWRRCPRLALAIVVIALARPLAEFALKELIGRERPTGDRLVAGRGPSFPSGHPLATAASWGLLPLVAALYTKRRVIWWSIAIAAWVLAVFVALSRVWLGVHWTSDVIASLALALLGVAAAEWFVTTAHGGTGCGQAAAVKETTSTMR